jgi:hypothetical protein
MRLSSRDSSKPDRLNLTRPGIDRPTSDGFGLHSSILGMITRSFHFAAGATCHHATQYANYREQRGKSIVTSVTTRLTSGHSVFHCGKEIALFQITDSAPGGSICGTADAQY